MKKGIGISYCRFLNLYIVYLESFFPSGSIVPVENAEEIAVKATREELYETVKSLE